MRDCSQGQQCPLLPGLPAEMLEIFNSGSVADVSARKTELRNTKQRTGLATNSFITVRGKKTKKNPHSLLARFRDPVIARYTLLPSAHRPGGKPGSPAVRPSIFYNSFLLHSVGWGWLPVTCWATLKDKQSFSHAP